MEGVSEFQICSHVCSGGRRIGGWRGTLTDKPSASIRVKNGPAAEQRRTLGLRQERLVPLTDLPAANDAVDHEGSSRANSSAASRVVKYGHRPLLRIAEQPVRHEHPAPMELVAPRAECAGKGAGGRAATSSIGPPA
jgi:hypothetical protein